MSFALEKESLQILQDVLQRLESGFSALPSANNVMNEPAMRTVMNEVADRLHDNYPYFHPMYAGQMLKPPHPIARIAYALALWINPNNHALDGGRASSQMEKEAVTEIARMFGWSAHLGHLTGGGTMANLEALWIAGRLFPGKTILASEQAHYTHKRIGAVLGVSCESVACDRYGRMDMNALSERLKKGGVSTVVTTMGTTATGSVDPLTDILELQKAFGFRIHCDAAYGGYFTLTENLRPETRAAFDAMSAADSIVIDPHKHGLQPYGCGCVLFRDPGVGRFYKHDSPYTYFSSGDLHLGEISLECSRAGAAAVALWATQRMFPLVRAGAFARDLQRGRSAALRLFDHLKNDRRFVVAFEPELDIVVWTVRSESLSRSSELARDVFDACAKAGLHLALAELPAGFFQFDASVQKDRDTVVCLRSVLMKPEHEEWVGEIVDVLNTAIGKF
jgi:glutamate/tyrosine decarboxylase-like PLP-dependent enzyme